MNIQLIIRILDTFFSILLLLFFLPLLLAISLVTLFSGYYPIYVSQRLGRHQELFHLYKLRTLHPSTPLSPTHLLKASEINYLPLGRFLRSTKLDELPQLFNVLLGQMSIVGPRPCLPSQCYLISLRARANIFSVRPGLIGFSQALGIDMSDPDILVAYDLVTLRASFNLCAYVKLIALTLSPSAFRDRIST
jgi:O-antigen biosynthesis protein WbqP